MTLTYQASPDEQLADAALPITRTRRILIAGSRNWPWPPVVHRVLDNERSRLPADHALIVVHGDCPAGADAAAAAWYAQAKDSAGPLVAEERYPARWRDPRGQLDRGAGTDRNGTMIATRPDLVIAFWLDHSPGTANTLRRAAEARIPALVHIAYGSGPEPAEPTSRAVRAAGKSTPTMQAARRPADADAERIINQGYSPTRNPLCGTCHTQKSLTGACFCG